MTIALVAVLKELAFISIFHMLPFFVQWLALHPHRQKGLCLNLFHGICMCGFTLDSLGSHCTKRDCVNCQVALRCECEHECLRASLSPLIDTNPNKTAAGWTMNKGLITVYSKAIHSLALGCFLCSCSSFHLCSFHVSSVLPPCSCFGFRCIYSDTLTERAAVSSGRKLGPDERDNQATAVSIPDSNNTAPRGG